MEKIKLQTIAELKAKEKLPEVPELVERYLALKEYRPEGKHFRIVVKKESRDSKVAGMAYLNELRVEKREGRKWVSVYSTGMMQYRGAYNYEIDDWDLSLNDPTIFEESKNDVVYALRTGTGNVKVYRFRKGSPENFITFNVRDHEATQKRGELLQTIIDDPKAFHSYVREGLGNRWHTIWELGAWRDGECQIFDAGSQKLESSKEIQKKGAIVLLLAKHYDRDYDALCDSYRIYVWLKGKGFGVSDEHRTGSRHPATRFYTIDLRFKEVAITNLRRDSLRLTVKVENYASYNTPRTHPAPWLDPKWEETRDFRVEWEDPEPTGFEREVEEAIEQVLRDYQHNHPLYYNPTRITEKVIDAERKIAAWILFEQIDTDRCTADGEGWLGDQFRYSLWVMKAGKKPKQLYEDHAYIRPRTKSELTGTRGRECIIKDLRLENGKVLALHRKGEKFEKQEWEELIF